MGLDCSHDAFHGAYSAFNRFRQCVAEAMGGSFPEHYIYDPSGFPLENSQGRLKRKEGFVDDRFYWGDGYGHATHPGLSIFFLHSDCEGEIAPQDCVKVANDLEGLLPKIEALNWTPRGYIAERGGFVEVTRKFIAGCREAAEKDEPLEFY